MRQEQTRDVAEPWEGEHFLDSVVRWQVRREVEATAAARCRGVTCTRLWDRARKAVLGPEQYASPLARRPYDLRHAAVSTWLNGGVAPTQVAEWAGHSVDVLLRIYAKCIDGGEEAALRRASEVLGLSDTGQ